MYPVPVIWQHTHHTRPTNPTLGKWRNRRRLVLAGNRIEQITAFQPSRWKTSFGYTHQPMSIGLCCSKGIPQILTLPGTPTVRKLAHAIELDVPLAGIG